MNWWPFGKREIREAQPFTDAIVNALVSQASGGNLPVTGLAALEMAAGAHARAFAGCDVEASERVKAILTPSILALIARDLIRRGESLHLISVFAGQLELVPCGSWDIRGEWTEDSWMYRVDLFGPSGNVTKLVPSSSIVHCRYSVDPARPWLGLSPLQWATSTGTLAANLEARLGQEAGGPVGYVLPVPIDSPPQDDGTGALDGLRKDIAGLKGQNVLIESTSGGWGEGKQAAPLNDWKAQRIGANPPDSLAALRSDTGRAILGACGVPIELFEASASGQGSREAWRRFVYGSVQPLARLVSEELTRKLETDVSLNFTELQAHDLTGRAISFQRLIESGMPADKAAGVSGLMALEVE